jgi:hypothetical protein
MTPILALLTLLLPPLHAQDGGISMDNPVVGFFVEALQDPDSSSSNDGAGDE